MRVVVVSPEGLPIPPSNGGSVQIYLSNLFGELSKLSNVDVILVSPGKSRETRTVSPHAIHLTLGAKKEAYWRDVHKTIRAQNPDVVQVDNRPAQALGIMNAFPRKRVILNLHSVTFLGKSHISRLNAREVLGRAVVVCNSKSLVRTIRARLGLPSTWRPHVIYPGVARPPQMIANHRSNPHAPLRVLFVGRVIEQKGVHVLIQAVRFLKRTMPVKLTVIGGTHPWEKDYRAKVRRMAIGLPVYFTGFVQPAKLASYYKSNDILVCPSQQHEAFGLVNLEAMSYGLPVVASRIGGIPEAVGNKGAILVKDYKNPKELANTIRSLALGERYRVFSTAAIRHSSLFTWRRTALRFMDVYRTLRVR